MKLVSFDVGLRNLAVCILEGTSRKDVKITHWDLIDVMAEKAGHGKPLCAKCQKPANWQPIGGTTFACTRHKPKSSKAPTKTALQKKTLSDLQAEGSPYGIVGTTKKALVEDCTNIRQPMFGNEWFSLLCRDPSSISHRRLQPRLSLARSSGKSQI